MTAPTSDPAAGFDESAVIFTLPRDHDLLGEFAEYARLGGGKIAFTNGCFDLLHAGHVMCLELGLRDARRLGGDVRLVVGMNSDASVRLAKGDGRPIVPQAQRAFLLSRLKPVSAVVVFDAQTPIDLVDCLKPDFLFKGDDYDADDIVGAKLVRGYGGVVFTLPRFSDVSTTGLVDKIRSAGG